jgi:hypothetical protein
METEAPVTLPSLRRACVGFALSVIAVTSLLVALSAADRSSPLLGGKPDLQGNDLQHFKLRLLDAQDGHTTMIEVSDS